LRLFLPLGEEEKGERNVFLCQKTLKRGEQTNGEEEKELKIFGLCCWKDVEWSRFSVLFHDLSFDISNFLDSPLVGLVPG